MGLLCYLVGLRDIDHAAAGPMGGEFFENWVIADFLKTFLHRGEESIMYFWQTATGSGVVILIETQTRLVPVEVKLT
jgi:hypothetical protein